MKKVDLIVGWQASLSVVECEMSDKQDRYVAGSYDA